MIDFFEEPEPHCGARELEFQVRVRDALAGRGLAGVQYYGGAIAGWGGLRCASATGSLS